MCAQVIDNKQRYNILLPVLDPSSFKPDPSKTDGSRTIRGRLQGVSTPRTGSKRFLGSMTNIILAERESKDRDVVGSGVGGTASWAWPDLFVLVFCRRRTLLLQFLAPCRSRSTLVTYKQLPQQHPKRPRLLKTRTSIILQMPGRLQKRQIVTLASNETALLV